MIINSAFTNIMTLISLRGVLLTQNLHYMSQIKIQINSMKDNGLLPEIYFNQCMNVWFSKMKKLNLEYYPKTQYLNDYTYDD